MPIIETKHLFGEVKNREQKVFDLVEGIFPGLPPQAVYYELLQQGLLQKGKLELSLNVWAIAELELGRLMQEWKGPDVPVYIFPITNSAVKNGVAYQGGICLFVSARVTVKELHALLAHEYHHMCRRPLVEEPPTVKDSLIMEGLAEHAVESLYGEHALSSWTKRYSMAEVREFWRTHFRPALNVRWVQNHRAFLYGDDQMGLPPWIGYCTGYRIVQAFQERYGPLKQMDLLKVSADEIIAGSGFGDHI